RSADGPGRKIVSAAGRPLSGVEDQLLNAPVKDFGDIQHILGWAGDFVNPAELLELLAGFTEHAQHLTVEAELIDTAGMRIGAVEHLLPVRTGRGDAQGPRRARAERAALRRTLRKVGLVADSGPGIRVVGNVDLDDVQELAVAVEHLDAPVGAV